MGVEMKKNMLTVLILALLLVNTVLTSVLMVGVMGTNKKTADLVDNIATVLNLQLAEENGEAQQVSLEDTVVYNLTTMTIPLNSGEGVQRYIQFDAALSMNTKGDGYDTYGETIADRESLIKDTITSVVSARTEDECRADLEGLKAEILQAIQDLFQSDFIYQVAISEVKFG